MFDVIIFCKNSDLTPSYTGVTSIEQFEKERSYITLKFADGDVWIPKEYITKMEVRMR